LDVVLDVVLVLDVDVVLDLEEELLKVELVLVEFVDVGF